MSNLASRTVAVTGLRFQFLVILDSCGMLLLSIWLIVNGLVMILKFSFEGQPLIMSILAIAAGVLILLGR